MFNSDQEDKIRNLLTVIVLYFQMESKYSEDDTYNELLENHKNVCKKAVQELLPIMCIDGSLPLPVSYKPEVRVVKLAPIKKEKDPIDMMKDILNNSAFI